ncbi:hypothetical protein HMPREF2999_00845 [Rothia sp. HMSC066H02]|jgi:hypothetical protein|uniref:Uncharacterized protein n=1 Tax=Rothia mucilaginosa TaxID=43675 RepID=A0A291DFR3_9MICC|nr:MULTISPECIES: hypothetical protein [Rothia]ATF63288.1 hypothetical protein CO690_06180 [Rothia mucilaginosa]OFO95527.1 hypothetical protein HMPREF3008_01220 [Rothia sp. HMSC065D09]OFP14819.1 hypothetical protein HMPREF2999_00845 [Rothia sp. HMSC066H02]OFR48433.1 hypothetical protein HMPREF2884_02790 [Rothia sp. HMSC073B08]
MSENGPVLPPEVYRRRRIVAVIALLAIILLLVAGVTSMVGMINGKKDATVASTATASGAPFQSFSARPSETASATPSASATASATATASASASVTPSVTASVAPTASATTATPVATPTTPAPTPSVTTAAVVAACTANDLKVTVTPAKRTFAAGEQVSFHVTYTNSSKTPCAVGGEGANTGVDLNITSGAAQVYTRSLCAATAVQKSEVAAGAEGATDLAWDRKINVLGCSSASTAQKGSYWATATVNGVTSAQVNFVIQ